MDEVHAKSGADGGVKGGGFLWGNPETRGCCKSFGL